MLWTNNSITQKSPSAILKELSPKEKDLHQEILIDIALFFDSLSWKNHKDDLSIYHALIAQAGKIYNDSSEIREHFSLATFKHICFTQSVEAAALLAKPDVKRYLAERAASKKAGTVAVNNLTQSVGKKTADIIPDKSVLSTEEYLAERRKNLRAKNVEINQKYALSTKNVTSQNNLLTRSRVAAITKQPSPQISKPRPTPNTNPASTLTPTEIDKIMRSGDTAKINLLMQELAVEEISVGKSKDPDAMSEAEFQVLSNSWQQEKKQVMLGDQVAVGELVVRINNLRKSYGRMDYAKVSEIHRLQNGDVVDFEKLTTWANQKQIEHFRIVQIEGVKKDSSEYVIKCLANGGYKYKGDYRIFENAPLSIRMPSTGLKNGTSIRVSTPDWSEFFTASIDGIMLVFTDDRSAFKATGFFKKEEPRFVRSETAKQIKQ